MTPFALPALLLALTAQAAPWTAPAEEGVRANPVEPTAEVLQKGRALYQRHCASCHGDKGKGDGPAARFGVKAPDDLTEPARQARLTDGEMLWKITTGLRQGSDVVMPGFRKEIASEEDRWKVVLHVRSLAQPKPSPP